MLLAYDNSVWCALEVYNGDRHGSFLDVFVILEKISLGFRPDHRLVTGFVQLLLVSHILLFLNLFLLHNWGNYKWLFGLYKLHFFGDIHI